MERLWSPWRTAHVAKWSRTSEDQKASLFERLPAEGDDERTLILWRGATCYVVLNLYPYNNGHCLIVPFRKVEKYTQLTGQEQVEISGTIDRVLRWLEGALEPDGFNVGINQGEAAGAGVPDHLHVHVVPRWASDTNFMPTTARAKVIPEALESTYPGDRADMVKAEDIPERRARIEAYDFRRQTPYVRFGTASDRYAGWIGQIYPEESWGNRIRSRSRKLAGTSFREETVPVASVADYFEHFDVLELDFTFYRPLLENDGRPGSNLNVLREYAEHAPDHARFLLKAPQAYFVRTLRRGGAKPVFESNPEYLDANACHKNFVDPAMRVLGPRLAGFVFEQSYARQSDSPDPNLNVDQMAQFFRDLGDHVQAHVELRSPHLLTDRYFSWLAADGIGFVFSHWSWLPPIREQWKMTGERFTARDKSAVCRLLTPLRVSYADAYALSHPFDAPRPELSESRGGRRMVLDATALAFQGLIQGHTVDLILNNRAWGNAPSLGQAIATRILEEEIKRSGLADL